MPCSSTLYPSYTPHIASYRQMEASMILARCSKDSQEEEKKPDKQAGLTPLDYRLRRDERRRKLYRNSSLRLAEPEAKKPIVEKIKTVVCDKLGNEIYVRGENKQDKWAREMDQWVKKMKCNVSTGMKLEQFKDIKVGIYQSDVVWGAPTFEPYPDLKCETDYSYSGGRDKARLFHGKGAIEFDDGSYMSGYWEHGLRQGDFKIETTRKGVCYIDGEYQDNKMNGKSVIRLMDDTWLEGFFKDGVLHGFCRRFDDKNRLTFIGMYRNGRPFGTCWRVIRGGGCVVGRVDEEGKLSGSRLAYLYPDFRNALVGTFKDGIMVCTQHADIIGLTTENSCIKVPTFSEPDGRLYRREISTVNFVTSSPTLPDPYETSMVEVRNSLVEGAQDGLFARKDIPKNTVLAFYNGVRIDPENSSGEDQDWGADSYKIFDPSSDPQGTIDIPEQFRSLVNYCAALAHKTNHSFVPNSEFMVYDHPRWGVIPCISSIHSVAAGEEIFVRYGYDLDYCPDWYLDAWEKGNYPVPESMKGEYGTNPVWAEATNDDKANQLPDVE